MPPSSNSPRTLARFLSQSRSAAYRPPLSRLRQPWRRLHSTRNAMCPIHSLLPAITPLQRTIGSTGLRLHSTSTTSPGAVQSEQDIVREEAPAYEMTFTCKVCQTRSTHRVSKQGYHHGTVLIQCPGCKNRHLIADHLKIFSDKSITLEDIMRDKGQLIKRGTLAVDGDVELWDDGEPTSRREADFNEEASQPAKDKPS